MAVFLLCLCYKKRPGIFELMNIFLFKTVKLLKKFREQNHSSFAKWHVILPTEQVKPNNQTSMKKTILMIAIAFGASNAFAQDLTSKKGEPYLPEAGDWAISFDAAPFLTYAGNLFNGSLSNGSPSVGYVKNFPWGITGKMFKDEKTAYRGMLRIGMGSTTMENFVADQTNTSTDPKFVTDSWKHSTHNILLGGGMEWRKGTTRLQGYYGGMLWISLGGSKDTYTYGNKLDATYTSPVSTDWSTTPPTSSPMAVRTTENKAGSTFGFGLRGFIGAEYFILPKISIGAEYGWGIGMMNTGDGSMTVEAFDAVSNGAKLTTFQTGGTKMFGLDTDISNNMIGSGSINITFHFGDGGK